MTSDMTEPPRGAGEPQIRHIQGQDGLGPVGPGPQLAQENDMSDDSLPSGLTGLTPALVQEIFPVARSDRREQREVFLGWIAEDRLKEDAVFYDALARMIAARDFPPLRRYDERMRSKRQEHKQFAVRAARYLLQQDPDFVARKPLDPEFFPALSAARAVHEFLAGLSARSGQEQALFASGPAEAAGPGDVPSAAPTPAVADWQALARELAAEAQALGSPDTAAAARLCALAEALADACRTAAQAAEQETARRAQALAARLAALDAGDGPGLPAAPGAAWLDMFERELDAAESGRNDMALARDRVAALDKQLQEALAAQDYGGLQGIATLAAEAKAKEGAAIQAATAALAAVKAMLGDEGRPAFAASAEPSVPATGGHDEVSRPGVMSVSGVPDAAASAPEVAPDPVPDPAPDPEPDLAPSSPLSPGDGGLGELPVAEAGSLAAAVATPPVAHVPPEVAPPPADHAPPAGTPQTPEPDVSFRSAQPLPGASAEPDAAAAAEVVRSALVRYLEAGETVLAWHLGRLSPGAVGIPAAVLRGVALLSAIGGADDMADPRRGEAMAEMMAALEGAADPVAAGRLALAALLRPALYDPDHGARDHLKVLREQQGIDLEIPLIEALSNLDHNVRLSQASLSQLAGGQPTMAAPGALARLAAWLEEARHRKTGHQPTYAILHRELQGQGELGRVIEAVLDAAPSAQAGAQALVDGLHDNRAEQERFVSEAERRSGRPRRDRIEGQALDWFCQRLQEACDHLSDWLAAERQDNQIWQDRGRDRLLSALGSLRKVVERQLRDRAERPGADHAGEAGLLARAADQLLGARIADLLALLEKGGAGPLTPRLRDLVEGPLLRLPGGCQDWTGSTDGAFATELEARDGRLLAAL